MALLLSCTRNQGEIYCKRFQGQLSQVLAIGFVACKADSSVMCGQQNAVLRELLE